MAKISTSIAIEAGKEYTCIKDGTFYDLDFIKGRVYRGVLAGKLQTHEGGRHVGVDVDHFEVYEPVEHLCIKEVTGGEYVSFIKGKKYKELKFRNIRAETGTTWRIGEGIFYKNHFKEVKDGDLLPEGPKENKGE